MADRVYPPVIVFLKTTWKYLGLKFTFTGDVNIPRNGGAILAINSSKSFSMLMLSLLVVVMNSMRVEVL